MMARLVSVNVGTPKDVPWNGRTVRTGIWKTAVAGRAKVMRPGVEGDGQADLVGHGGEQRAVLVYQLSSYGYWQAFLQRASFPMGQFGENLSVDGLEDELVCIGDRYRIGSALFEVTQPRVTCFKVGIRMEEPRMAALLVAHRRPGFYMRVIEEGEIASGDGIEKISSGPEHMTVAVVDALLYGQAHPAAELERALRIDALSPGWKASFRSLLGAAGDDAVGNVGLAAGPEGQAAWAGFLPLRVAASCQESEEVRSFLLESADGTALPAWQPGQHVAVKVPMAAGRWAIRMYSLSGAPDADKYRISVKSGGPGTVSGALHSSVRVGDTLQVSAPRGVFTLAGAVTPVVLMSAGVGVTPLLAMLHALSRSPERGTRRVWWIHAAHDRRHHTLRAEAALALAACGSGRRQIFYSRPEPSDVLGEDYDAAGHIDLARLREAGLPIDADYYLCGPPSLLRSLTDQLGKWGVERRKIHVEYFGAEPRPTKAARDPSSPQAPRVEEISGPHVNFVRSGISTRWGSGTAYRSLLELAEACEIPVQWSCRTGVCHSCQTPVVEGSVTYEPVPLSAPAHGTALLCCARPAGDISIDL
jgi:ferredoxin-NADP reductase/MOSC domain-containing protein YiiM